MRYGDISSFQSGVAVPLFSLRSRASIGIGEFLDLIPFAKWCKMCDFDIIQLLPVNDTGAEASPYSARSAFALNPVFINIQAVQGSGEFENEIDEAKAEFDHQARIDYYKISTWKRTMLRHIFDNRYDQIKKDKELSKWIDNNSWARAYCAYSMLKAQNGEASWKDWKKYQNPTAEDIEKLWSKNQKEMLYQAWMQFMAELQFSAAVNEASKLGIRIKGDIPILINEDSADVWANRNYFSLDDRAGAPPRHVQLQRAELGIPHLPLGRHRGRRIPLVEKPPRPSKQVLPCLPHRPRTRFLPHLVYPAT